MASNVMVLISLAFVAATVYGFWRLAKISQMHAAKQYKKAADECTMLMLFSVVFGAAELAIYGMHLPLVWVALLVFALMLRRRILTSSTGP